MRFVVAFVLLMSIAAAQVLPTRYPPLTGDAVLEQTLLEASNNARRSFGVPSLEVDPALALAARHHAQEMAGLGYFSHDSPVADHATPARRAARAGSAAVSIAENLARLSLQDSSQNSPQDDIAGVAVQGWLDSPGHRANLLDGGLTHVGFGTARGAQGRVYIVQLFAAEPLRLRRASVSQRTREGYAVSLTLMLTSPQEVVVLHNRETLGPMFLAAGRQPLTFITDATRTHLELAVRAASGGGFILEESGWLEPATGSYHPDPSAPRTTVAVLSVSSVPQREQVYRVRLELVSPPTRALGWWLNGDYQGVPEWVAGGLEFDVAATAFAPRLELGLAGEDGRFEGALRLALDFSLGYPRVVAGVP